MRVLVTGAFGYLGSALVRRLAREPGLKVTAAGRHVGVVPDGVETLEVDLLRGLRRGRRADVLVHLAGGGGPAACDANPLRAVLDHVLCAEATAAALGRRRIFASSLYVYPPWNRTFTESHPCEPDTLYGAYKLAGEHVFTRSASKFDQDTVVLRFAHVYGPSPVRHDDVASRFAGAAANGHEATIHGEGTRRIDLVHIDDACKAILAAIYNGDEGGTFNIGGGQPVSVAEIANLAGAKVVHSTGDAADKPDRWLNITRARDSLAWTPAIHPQDGIRALVAAMREERA